jgi:hypothetical protein
VLGLEVLADVPVRPTIARAVDAGTLSARVPEALARASTKLLDALTAHVAATTTATRAA